MEENLKSFDRNSDQLLQKAYKRRQNKRPILESIRAGKQISLSIHKILLLLQIGGVKEDILSKYADEDEMSENQVSYSWETFQELTHIYCDNSDCTYKFWKVIFLYCSIKDLHM